MKSLKAQIPQKLAALPPPPGHTSGERGAAKRRAGSSESGWRRSVAGWYSRVIVPHWLSVSRGKNKSSSGNPGWSRAHLLEPPGSFRGDLPPGSASCACPALVRRACLFLISFVCLLQRMDIKFLHLQEVAGNARDSFFVFTTKHLAQDHGSDLAGETVFVLSQPHCPALGSPESRISEEEQRTLRRVFASE
jgi:hypothetical protein